MLHRFVLAIFLVIAVAPAALASDGTMDADAAWKKAQAGELVIVDVRSKGEWKSTGIPKGAKTVTIHNPEGLEGFYKEVVAALGEDKTQAIAMICAAGGRSARAQRFLAEKGYKNIVDIEEGMLGTYSKPGWIKRGLPTQPYGG